MTDAWNTHIVSVQYIFLFLYTEFHYVFTVKNWEWEEAAQKHASYNGASWKKALFSIRET